MTKYTPMTATPHIESCFYKRQCPLRKFLRRKFFVVIFFLIFMCLLGIHYQIQISGKSHFLSSCANCKLYCTEHPVSRHTIRMEGFQGCMEHEWTCSVSVSFSSFRICIFFILLFLTMNVDFSWMNFSITRKINKRGWKKNNYFNKLWINDEGQICEVWVHHEVFVLRVNYCSWVGRRTISTLLTENIGILLLMYFHLLTSIPYLHHANRKKQNLNIHDIFSFCMFFICVNVGALQGVKKSLSRYIHILYSQLYCGWFLWGVVRLD